MPLVAPSLGWGSSLFSGQPAWCLPGHLGLEFHWVASNHPPWNVFVSQCIYIRVKNMYINWLVVEPPHLKKILVKVGSSSRMFEVKTNKYLKPPPSKRWQSHPRYLVYISPVSTYLLGTGLPCTYTMVYIFIRRCWRFEVFSKESTYTVYTNHL